MENTENTIVKKDNYEIIGIRFKEVGKVYYFDPAGMTFKAGDKVIVETARGIEYGNVLVGNKVVSESEIVTPLKKVIRKATEKDEKQVEANNALAEKAKAVFRERVIKHGLDMTLVDAEYTFDSTKLLFYFTSDGRVDFREFVKDMASVFKTRIELRQIGVRDEAKQLGGLGVCGRPFCCKSFLNDFEQVSIKMAKEQGLSLNSVKISGTCGRLMCCLRYENDVYEEEIKKTPAVGSIVQTPEGKGCVTESNPLSGLIKVSLDAKKDAVPSVFARDDVKILKAGKRDDGDEDIKFEE